MLASVIAFAKSFKVDRKAVTALEYGLIAGVLGVAIIAAFTGLGTQLKTEFTTIEKSMTGN